MLPLCAIALIVIGPVVALRRRWVDTAWTSSAVRPASVAKAQDALRNADAVCFDVDSTVCETEGIDVLARCLNKYEEVANLTRVAMDGKMTFQEALARRLDIMRPTRAGIDECLTKEKFPLTKGVQNVMATLRARGSQLYLISGGFTVMVEPIAKLLGIPPENIFANHLIFDDQGMYKDFDRKAPTSMSRGKAKVIHHLQRSKKYHRVVMVGDGATDMEARPPAEAFIGFGGVQVREKVKQGADWFVTSWQEILDIL